MRKIDLLEDGQALGMRERAHRQPRQEQDARKKSSLNVSDQTLRIVTAGGLHPPAR